jgi:hypothetical protein
MLDTANKILNSTCRIFDEQQAAVMAGKIAYRIKHMDKFRKLKKKRIKARQKRKDRKQERINALGKARYYLSELFGQWVIYL